MSYSAQNALFGGGGGHKQSTRGRGGTTANSDYKRGSTEEHHLPPVDLDKKFKNGTFGAPEKDQETTEPMESAVANEKMVEYRERLCEAISMGFCGYFSLQFQGKTINVSELAFAIALPAFMRLMKSDCKEAKTHKINVGNLSIKAVKQFVGHVHGEEVENLEFVAIAKDVLHFADKFEMPELQKTCLDYIMSHQVSKENIVKYLKYAFKRRDESLKREAIGFVIGTSDGTTFEEFLRRGDWRALMGSDLSLAFEIMGVMLIELQKRFGECKAKLGYIAVLSAIKK